MSDKLTVQQFIAQANKKHDNKYKYEKAVYVEAHTKLTVTCAHHGDWGVTPDSHKRGAGCPACGFERMAKACKLTKEEFVNTASTVHSYKYDYSLVEYVSMHKKVKILCPVHGLFEQSPANHNAGKGCRDCMKNGYRTSLAGSLYVLQSGSYIKVGITNREVSVRLHEIQRDSGEKVSVVFSQLFNDGSIPLSIETQLLKELRVLYQQPSTKFDGSTECFSDVDLPNLLARISELITQSNDSQRCVID
jgi:hypothetical protein